MVPHRNGKRLILAALCCCSAAGCGSSVQDAPPPQPVATLEAKEKVSLVKIDGELAEVRKADGSVLYVRAAQLQDRSTLDRSDEQYTHVLSAATEAYDNRPAVLPEQEPRPMKEVAKERFLVNQLYLTERTNKEVIAPARLMTPWDEEAGERCFPALTCHNPNCPGEGSGDRPYLFIVPYSPGSSGPEITCPACAAVNDPATRSEEERQKYRKWAKPYRLPEQAARLKQLDEEARAAPDFDDQRIKDYRPQKEKYRRPEGATQGVASPAS